MKLITTLFFSFIFCLAMNSSVFAANGNYDTNKVYEEGEIDPCAEVQCGPCTCYCPVTRYRPEKYCVTRCCEEPYTVQKQCCRYVDEPYCVKKCRYVPEYYTKTCEKKCCKMVPEYYQVTCCRMVPQYSTQCYEKQCCRQVPQYYEVQCCRKVPQYYTVCEQKCRTRTWTEEKCRYVPYTCIVEKTLDCDVCQRGQPAQPAANQNAQYSQKAAPTANNQIAERNAQINNSKNNAGLKSRQMTLQPNGTR